MEISHKKTILGLVILMELVSLWYVFPKMDSPRATRFTSLWSKMCVNSEDLFEANSRFFKIRPSLYVMDDRVSMYYADLTPQPNKNYLIYFDTTPSSVSHHYDVEIENGQKIYMLKGLTWRRFIDDHLNVMEEYLWGDFPQLIRRKDMDPYVEFTKSVSRDHGEK